jgi:hypothetical protein
MGPAGPAGPSGPRGATGPQGPQGEPPLTGGPLFTINETNSVTFATDDDLAQVGGMLRIIDLTRETTLLIVGNLNVTTDRAAFLHIVVDGEKTGSPFFTNATNVWTNVPFVATVHLQPGAHEIRLVVDRYGGTVRIGSRVMTAVAF